jgi:hypothetical protein
VLCTLLFVPGGLVAVFYSVQVNRRVHQGQWEAAWRASRAARIWCFISAAGFVLVYTAVAASGAFDRFLLR